MVQETVDAETVEVHNKQQPQESDQPTGPTLKPPENTQKPTYKPKLSKPFIVFGILAVLLLGVGVTYAIYSINAPGKQCVLNGKTYQPGEGFRADDGCNTCTCEENGEIGCTLMACLSDQEVSTGPSDTGDDPNAEWQTYINREHGISFMYPPEWNMNKEGQYFEQGDLVSFYIWGDTQGPNTELYDGASFAVANPVSFTDDLSSWAQTYHTESRVDPDGILEFGTETIAGKEYSTAYTCGLGCFQYYYIVYDGMRYGFVASVQGPDEAEYQQAIDQMLSSVEFVE